MRSLIVTADDVGLHEGMTRGAIEAHRHGIVTACSVAACGTRIEQAIEAISSVPELDVGAHLMLVEGRPVRPPERVRTLLGADGAFLGGYTAFVARYLAGRVAIAEVEDELRAQLERLTAAGCRLVHVNSHQHLHLLPAIFDIAVRLACEFSIPYVRVVRDAGSGGGVRRRLSVYALGRLGRRANAGPLRTSDRTLGVHGAGRLTAATLIGLLEHVEGLTELVTHPGIGNREISRAYDWRYDWDGETAALCDPDVTRAIARLGIRVSRMPP